MRNTTRVQQWYFNRIPAAQNTYIQFLSNAHELGHADTEKYESTPNKFSIPQGTTARIPEWVLDDTVFEDVSLQEKRAYQTAFWNHSILMNKRLMNTVDNYRKGEKYTYSLAPSLSLMDYVLSLHATEQLSKSPYGVFTQTTHDFLYTPQTLVGAVNEMVSTQQVGGVLEHYLNPDLRQDVTEILGEDITDILDKIVSYKGQTTKGLASLCSQLYDLLNKQQEDNKPEPEDEEGESDQDGEKGNGPQQWLDDHSDIEPKEDVTVDTSLTPAMEEATQALQEAMDGSGGWDKTDNTERIKVVDVADPQTLGSFYTLSEGTPIEASDVFANLGNLLRQIKVIKEIPIDPQLYGGDLLEEELYRVTTDHRVMGLLDEQKQVIKKEIRVVCDLSGSTNTRPFLGTKYLWQTELEAAKGAFLSLRDAREDVAVYGHSTIFGPVLYKIASAHDVDTDRRFRLAAGVQKGSNYDDEIIEWIARNDFNYPDSLKIIIMLSDGKPCGSAGIEGTHDLVTKLRRKGFVIMSVSLVSAVVSNNNEIYGKDWNIDASHGDLDEKLRDLFIRISSEYKEK